MPEFDINPHLAALIELLHTSAFTALGKLKDPQSGEIHRNLEVARFYIDTLEMIEAKTLGNLTDAEKRHLAMVLDTLRLNYLDEAKKPEAAPSSASEDDTA